MKSKVRFLSVNAVCRRLKISHDIQCYEIKVYKKSLKQRRGEEEVIGGGGKGIGGDNAVKERGEREGGRGEGEVIGGGGKGIEGDNVVEGEAGGREVIGGEEGKGIGDGGYVIGEGGKVIGEGGEVIGEEGEVIGEGGEVIGEGEVIGGGEEGKAIGEGGGGEDEVALDKGHNKRFTWIKFVHLSKQANQ